MEQTSIQDDMTPKWHFVLDGQSFGGGRWKSGEVVELLPSQANGYIGQVLSNGYVTEKGAQSAAERDATVADAPKPRSEAKAEKQEDAPTKSAKEVSNNVS